MKKEIVSPPDSSSTIWKSCTTFGRRNYLRLGDLGTLQIGISSKGAVTEEDYDVSLITKARINFRPGLALAGILTGLTYKKVAKKPVKTNESETEEGGEDLTA